jgi:hypothetical protein
MGGFVRSVELTEDEITEVGAVWLEDLKSRIGVFPRLCLLRDDWPRLKKDIQETMDRIDRLFTT